MLSTIKKLQEKIFATALSDFLLLITYTKARLNTYFKTFSFQLENNELKNKLKVSINELFVPSSLMVDDNFSMWIQLNNYKDIV